MATSWYPEQKLPFYLPIHAKVDEKQRPTFYTTMISAREQIKLEGMVSKAAELEGAGDRDGAMNVLIEMLAILLVDWKNLPNDFDPAILANHLQYEDVWAVYSEAQKAQRATREELGKSESPSTSSGDDSAPTAATETAATSQTKPPPPSTSA